MKSFCIKTNNNLIIKYLLDKFEKIDLENVYFSSKEFKIYSNVIIHYKGENICLFNQIITDIILETILKFYKEKLIRQIINYNYFYFEEYEKDIIQSNFKNVVESKEYGELDYGNNYIYEAVLKYIIENKSMVLDGFVTFRLKEYVTYLDNIVDIAVNKYIIEKEYNEFISLLKVYVDSKGSNSNLLYLMYVNSESIILDENRDIVSMGNNLYKPQYLSDISFSSNDLALNTLLTLLPNRIEIHLIGEEDEFINTLKLIFEDRVCVCKMAIRRYAILRNTNKIAIK